jgi:hypothetical protein
MSMSNRRWAVLFAAVVLTPGLLWVGWPVLRSLRPLPPLPRPLGREVAWSATEWSHLPADGERCTLANNVWNKSAAGRNLEQEVFVEDLDGQRTLGWRWRSPWQVWPAIAAYPEMICGNKPWDEPFGAYDGLPFHPGDKRLTANYSIRLQATGTYNMAFELWGVSALPGSPNNIRTEIMIWIANSGQRPSGIRRASVEVGGVVYDTYINPHQHDASGANPNEWTYVAFVARTPVLQGPLNISAFLDTLGPLKILTPDLWITDVELGNEVTEGTGIAEVQGFGLRMEQPLAEVPEQIGTDGPQISGN